MAAKRCASAPPSRSRRCRSRFRRSRSRLCTNAPKRTSKPKKRNSGLRSGYLGLGSNIGDREGHLRAAIEMLGKHGVEVEAVSSAYETEPVGEVLDQPDFLNAAIRIRTGLEPEELLDVCKTIEVERGRMFGGQRHGPRPLDIDLLLLGDIELSTERLTLPHRE